MPCGRVRVGGCGSLPKVPTLKTRYDSWSPFALLPTKHIPHMPTRSKAHRSPNHLPVWRISPLPPVADKLSQSLASPAFMFWTGRRCLVLDSAKYRYPVPVTQTGALTSSRSYAAKPMEAGKQAGAGGRLQVSLCVWLARPPLT